MTKPVPFTLVMAYYENAGMLREHYARWLELPAPVRAHLQVIVVDDGSPTASAFNALDPGQWVTLKMGLARLQLWRMGVDVRWNQDACRNIAAREAATEWLLLTDMDHVVPRETWEALMRGTCKPAIAYRFARQDAPDRTPYKPHPNSWAITRSLYWQAGGYDETLAGYYGTDGDFLNRVRAAAHGELLELKEPLIRYPREVIPDASTTTLQRKSETDKAFIISTVKSRGPGWRPRHFSFPCERLL